MKMWAACMVVLVTLLGAVPASAGPVLIEFTGTIVTGGIKGVIGGDVKGTALFPDDLTDQIKGGFEDWWETKGFAAFTFQGGGIDFKTSSGDYSSLRLEDGGLRALDAESLWLYPREDAFRYEGVQGSNSLVLQLSGGGVDALLPGSGGLTGSVPNLKLDGSQFEPCAVAADGTPYGGSCSQFATEKGTLVFQITGLSVTQSPEPSTLLLIGVAFASYSSRRVGRAFRG